MFDIKISAFADEINQDFDTQLTVLNEYNIGYMEIRNVNGTFVDAYDFDYIKELKAKLDQHQVKISAVGSPIGKIKITDDFEPHFERFKRVVEIARILDTKFIRMFSFYIPEGEDAAKYRDEVHYRLKKFIAYAKEADVVLLHENEKEIYGDIPSRCKDLMDELYCDNFKAIFDFANFVQCKSDTLEGYELLEPYIEYIHVKDAQMSTGSVVPSGMGDGHIPEILKMLKEKDYNGFLSIEPHLSHFAGFDALENRAIKSEEKIDGKVTFATAYNALQDVLKSI